MTNDIWTWLIHEQCNAYQANKIFSGPNSMHAGPCWCFSRFGQSKTPLPDGRTIFVAGEHEDSYDPDFYIYNDLVAVEKSGEISIFGYPVEVFPPTDFHSATLVDNTLILIGNLGYSKKRIAGHTQVLRLELDTWETSIIETSGKLPGWIHKHQARLLESGHEILVTGGRVDRCDTTSLLENIDDWSFDLRTGQWKRLTQRNWIRILVRRKDGKRNHLWDMRQAAWEKRIPPDVRDQYNLNYHHDQELKKELGAIPDLDVLDQLYAPNCATEILKQNDENIDDDEIDVEYENSNTYRIRIGDVTVRYFEDSYHIKVTIEGELPHSIVEQLKEDLVKKLEALERSTMVCDLILPD